MKNKKLVAFITFEIIIVVALLSRDIWRMTVDPIAIVIPAVIISYVRAILAYRDYINRRTLQFCINALIAVIYFVLLSIVVGDVINAIMQGESPLLNLW